VSRSSKTPAEISSQIIATLATTCPGLSCELGTPERKIIDACAEAISAAYVDQYLVGSLLDIENKSGLELEQFVGIFGYGRLAGKAAKGVVRMTLSTTSASDQNVSLGTQFYTNTAVPGASAALYFASTQAVVLTAGSYSIDIPVQCTTVGTVGNVPPGSITSLGSTLATATVTNLAAMSGGVDVETDAELRMRFKATLLRNIAGTSDWYRAIALQNNTVSRVTVFGPTTLYTTQIEVPATTLTLPVTQDVKYAWGGMSSCFTDLGQESEVFYSDVDDYNLSAGVSPVFTTISTGALANMVGQVVDLEFSYTTRSSRNDPPNGITNKVDVFTDGVTPVTVTEQTVVTSTALSASSASPYYTGKFRRVGSAGTPSATNRFMRLGSVPIVSFPATITSGVTVYAQGTHYYLLADTTLLAGGPAETSGIEWTGAGPANGTELTLTYTYNQVPELLQAIVDTSKQVCTDVMVHQAAWSYLVVCLCVEYDRSYSVAITNSAIRTQLQTYFQGLGFGPQLKVAGICLAVQQVLGVLDLRRTTSADDSTDYGIEVFANPTDPSPQTIETDDFKVSDNALAVFQDVIITRKAAP